MPSKHNSPLDVGIPDIAIQLLHLVVTPTCRVRTFVSSKPRCFLFTFLLLMSLLAGWSPQEVGSPFVSGFDVDARSDADATAFDERFSGIPSMMSSPKSPLALWMRNHYARLKGYYECACCISVLI